MHAVGALPVVTLLLARVAVSALLRAIHTLVITLNDWQDLQIRAPTCGWRAVVVWRARRKERSKRNAS
jgi:hypothetical protein